MGLVVGACVSQVLEGLHATSRLPPQVVVLAYVTRVSAGILAEAVGEVAPGPVAKKGSSQELQRRSRVLAEVGVAEARDVGQSRQGQVGGNAEMVPVLALTKRKTPAVAPGVEPGVEQQVVGHQQSGQETRNVVERVWSRLGCQVHESDDGSWAD
jgi:hypothetical protein